jgi:serpin B
VSFNPALTRSEPFTTAAGSDKTVAMMHRSAVFPYYAGTDVQAISVPYGKKRFDLVALLPRPGVSLTSLARRLNSATWKGWMSQLHPAEVGLGLPRLKLQDQHNLVPALSSLGMGIAFTDAADFSGMCVYPCLISQAVQKTYLAVDEKGTTASGATGVGIAPTAAPSSLELNRPFLLAIRDSKTGAILFLGAIQNPS